MSLGRKWAQNECFYTERPNFKGIFTLLLSFLMIFSFSSLQVHASPRLDTSAPLTPDASVPMSYINGTPPVHQYTITLITGDILYVTKPDKGTWSVAVKEAPRRGGSVSFETFSDSQKGTYAVPADVVSLIPNFLDPYLFNLDYITQNHLNDESTSIFGALVQYAPGSTLSNQWDTNLLQYSTLSMVNSQALSIPKENAAEFGSYILSQPRSLPSGIEKIWLDKVATVADDQSVQMIGADIARNVLGYNGSGVNIAILDTGIDATHPDFFFANGTSKVIVQIDATCMAEPIFLCDHTTKDLFGHGTHVASIAAGTGAASGGRYIGVAPGANLMNIKVLGRFGAGFYSWIITGLQLASQGINGVRADVISMSLGALPTDGSDPLSQAINQIVSVYGIPVVVAAGNAGCNFCVDNPGSADDAIAVAATTKALSPAIPAIASFSSRGPRLDNFDIKPDISAPGVGIVAACSSTAGTIKCPVGSQYVKLSGTSMATPHVSGSVALLLQQAKQRGITLTPFEIKNILQSSSAILPPSAPGGPDVDIYQQGSGLVRIDHALQAGIIFSSSEISFGDVPFTTPSLERSFQVTNLGTTSITLNLSYEMRDVPTPLSPLDTGALYNNLVSLNETQLSIAAGSSATVTLVINVSDAPTLKLWNIFSGRIFATSGNTTLAHAIFGFAKEGPRQTALFTRIIPTGSYLVFSSYSIYDALDPLGYSNFFVSVNSYGQTLLRLPLSSYNFIMDMVVNPVDGILSDYRIVALEVPVTTSPANVTLDANKAGPVKLNLQADPSATHGWQQDDIMDYIRPDGSNVLFGDSVLRQTWDTYQVNNATAKIGTLWTYDRWLVTRSPAATSPVMYDLSMTNHTQQPITHTVNELSGLSKTYATFDVDPAGGCSFCVESNFGRWTFPMAFNLTVAYTSNYDVAGVQRIEYQQPLEAGYDQIFYRGTDIFWFNTRTSFNYFGTSQLGRVDSPAETRTETWGAQPIHPRLTLAERQNDTLVLKGFEVTDNYGHFGANVVHHGVNFQIKVYVDGTLTTVNNHISSLSPDLERILLTPVTVALPRRAATVEVAMQMQPNRSWDLLATNVTSDIVFVTNPGQQGPIPLPTYNYAVNNLNVLNQVQLDNSENLQIKVSLLAPDGTMIRPVDPSAQIALNFGSNWTPANVTVLGTDGMLVTAHIPATGHGYDFFVSLRISALTAHGITYTQTITTAVEAIS